MTPRVLMLGGIDPCGGAGITADAVVAAQHGARALPVALALTEQNRHGFVRCHAVDEQVWTRSLECALADGDTHAIKVGLLANVAQIASLAARLQGLRGRLPIVVDPVLSATAGGMDTQPAHAAAYVERLVPLATLVTPNAPELDALGGATGLLSRGAMAVLRKGGHDDGPFVEDVLTRASGEHRWRRPRLAVGRVHGTGCALATAIAVALARGASLESACERAGDWLHSRLLLLGPASDDQLPRDLPVDAMPGGDQSPV